MILRGKRPDGTWGYAQIDVNGLMQTVTADRRQGAFSSEASIQPLPLDEDGNLILAWEAS